jgi:hypothetical protein
VVEALPHESLRLVADLVEAVLAEDPYTVLKGRLLSAHQLTDFQRAESLFTMVDRSTRWAEAVPVASMSSKACAEALFVGWIARFGVPVSITSDRGTQFASEFWAHMCEVLGIQHQMTTAYHPQANGLVERFHRQPKNSLQARLCGPDWASHLPWVLLGLRAASKEDAGVSSAELVYGSPLTLPGQFLEARDPPVEDFLQRLQRVVQGSSLPTRPLAGKATSSSIPAGLMEAVYIYVRRDGQRPPLAQLDEGPCAVISRGEKTFKLQVGPRELVVSIDRLKPHLGSASLQVVVPAARGRPPAVPAVPAAKVEDTGEWTLVLPRKKRRGQR